VFRNLPLIWKVTGTLVAVFSLIVAVFLVLLVPFQQAQLDDLLEFNESVLRNLERVYRNRLIYDLLGEGDSDQSLVVTLRELVDQDPAILFAKVIDPEGGLVATTDPGIIRRVFDEAAGAGGVREIRSMAAIDPATDRPVMLLRRGRETRIIGLDGRSYALPDVGFDSEAAAEISRIREEEGLARKVLPTGGALVLTQELEAASRSFGTLQLAYSLAIVERNRARTRWIFYGLIGSSFIILLLFLNLLIRRIVVAPLRRMFRAMRAAGRGDLQQELPVTSRDEFGEMSSNFNQMVRKLRQGKEEVEQYSRNLERMVSERTRALRESQEDLTRLKNYLVTVLENVGAGVLSIDRDERVTTFNERAREILRLDGEVEGRPFTEVFAGDGLAPVHRAVTVASGDEPPREIEIRLPSGRRTLSIKVTRLAEGDREIGKVVVFDDVTELIYSKKLSAWKEAVEKVIHEIKNPLTPIRLSTQQLRAAFEDRSPHFEKMFDRGTRTILSSVENLQQLVSDFSHFYRLHAANLAPCELNPILVEICANYAEALPDGVRLEKDLGPGLPAIRADAAHLKRVFANLVQNGIDAMDGGSGVVRVRSEYRAERKRVAVVVEDEGRGMDRDEMDKVFEPYFTTKVKGTGLGLVITKQIVEEHQGELRMRSRPNRGTKVEILFPVR